MTHDISRAEAEALENELAEALELDIVDRSDAHDEAAVRKAFGDEAVEADRVVGRGNRTKFPDERLDRVGRWRRGRSGPSGGGAPRAGVREPRRRESRSRGQGQRRFDGHQRIPDPRGLHGPSLP